MKKQILLLSAFILFLGLPVSAQNEDTPNPADIHADTIHIYGHSLSIYRDTLNAIPAYSGSIAAGKNNTVSSFYSAAFGVRNTLMSNREGIFVFGSDNTVSSSGSFAVGSYLSLSGNSPSVVIGEGLSPDAPLANTDSHCLQVGFLSTKPTLTVTQADNNIRENITDRTGRVAIGNVTPSAKLHIKSDSGEEAGIILEPKYPQSNGAFIRLRDNTHRISVNNTGLMQLTAGNNPLSINSGNFTLSSAQMTLGGATDPRFLMVAQGTPALYSNATPSHGNWYRIVSGSSYALLFQRDGLLLRTAEDQQPIGSEITNWRDALFVGTDRTITLNGKVGVNTENTTDNYALAVDGGILATKVYVTTVNYWPDYVFNPNYDRMTLGELETYLNTYHHLPDVPSATVVEEDGYDLAAMQATLLRKVEELTLYTLEQQKLIEELKIQNVRQQRQLDALLSGDTLRFAYDACGNRTSRTIEFSRMNEDEGTKGSENPKELEKWYEELHDTFLGNGIVLFPNPTEGRFTLVFQDGIPHGATATLLTLTGSVLSERRITDNPEEFDLGGRPAGIYLLHLATEKETATWKIVKRN